MGTSRSERKVLVKILLKLPEGQVEVVHEAFPRNLQLTCEYNLSKVAVAETSSGSSKTNPAPQQAEAPGKAAPACALKDSEPEVVRMEPGWHKFLADADKLNKGFWLKNYYMPHLWRIVVNHL